MKRMAKVGIMVGAVLLALPLCAVAAESVSGAQQARAAAVAQQEEEADEGALGSLHLKKTAQGVGEYIEDAEVTAKVKSTFIGQKGLHALDIKVVTVDGMVTLTGDVDNSAQISLAEEVAKDVGGVKKVENKLVVKK